MRIDYLAASKDVNGNPRRGWLVTKDDDSQEFVNEGYDGLQALRDAGYSHWADNVFMDVHNITVKQYNTYRKGEF